MLNLIPWKTRRKQEQESGRKNLPDRFRDPFGAGDFFPGWPFSDEAGLEPKIDLKEGRKHITVKAEIPGMDKNDIDISLENGVLRIEGEKRNESEEKDETYYRRESYWGRFLRRVELPAEVDENDVEAKYRKGVLTVKLKKTKNAERKKIKVKSA
ncbi:MAG: Hsp20/alpha crystallin family protein [Desulfosalsimonas sp.]